MYKIKFFTLIFTVFYVFTVNAEDIDYFISNEKITCQNLNETDNLLRFKSVLEYEKTLLNTKEINKKQKNIRELMINCAEYIYNRKEFHPYIKDYSVYLENKLFLKVDDFFDGDKLYENNKNIEKILATYGLYLNHTKRKNDQLEQLKKVFKARQTEKNQCKAANVDTTHMGPVQNQEDVGWCYAFASADIYSFYAKERVSALDMAVLYNNFSPKMLKRKSDVIFFNIDIKDETIKKLNLNPKDVKANVVLDNTDASLEGGSAFRTLDYSIKNGVCSEKDFPNMSHDHVSLSQKLNAPAYYKLKSSNSQFECVNRLGRIALLFPNLNLAEIEEIVQKSNVDSMLYSLRNKACRSLVKLPNKLVNFASNELEAIRSINKSLDKNEPSVVSYDIKMLLPNIDGGHASTVIGRRFNNKSGQCEYQIRNSWGKNIYRAPFSKIEHDQNGNYWVDEKTLMNHIIGASTLQSK